MLCVEYMNLDDVSHMHALTFVLYRGVQRPRYLWRHITLTDGDGYVVRTEVALRLIPLLIHLTHCPAVCAGGLYDRFTWITTYRSHSESVEEWKHFMSMIHCCQNVINKNIDFVKDLIILN